MLWLGVRVGVGDLFTYWFSIIVIVDYSLIPLQIIYLFVMYQKKRRQVGNRSKYVKIPMKTKLKFLRMVVAESFSVKDVLIDLFRQQPFSK